METIRYILGIVFSIITIIFFITFIIGLINPLNLNKKNDENPKIITRKDVLKTLPPIILLSFILSFSIFPDSNAEKIDNTSKFNSQSSDNSTKPVPAPVPQPTQNITSTEKTKIQDTDNNFKKEFNGPGPNGESIKGNINSKGEKIYHTPKGALYNKTEAEEWFFTEGEAKSAGYRASKK